MGIVILGAGGHAGVVIDLIEAAMGTDCLVGRVELLDDNIPTGQLRYGKKIAGKIMDCMRYPKDTEFIIGIGNNHIRKNIAERYQLNYITLIHPSAVTGRNVSLGKGTVVMAGAVVGCESQIGEHCIINTGATVDHECRIGNYVHISPGAHLGGEVEVGERSWMGIGCCVKNGIRVGNDITIGAGGVVINNIKNAGIYTGTPVKKW